MVEFSAKFTFHASTKAFADVAFLHHAFDHGGFDAGKAFAFFHVFERFFFFHRNAFGPNGAIVVGVKVT